MSEQPTPETPHSAPAPQTTQVAPQPNVPPAAPYTPPAGPIRPQSSGLRRIFLLNGIALLVLILIGLGIFYLWHQSYYFYSTDDATVSGNITTVSPPVAGVVTAVSHGLGDTVRRGATIADVRSASGRAVAVTSPINGTIIQEGATSGEVAAPGQPLAQVVDLNAIYITAYVEETHIGDVHLGQGVDVKVDQVGGTTFHGRVTRILPVAAGALSLLPTTDYASGNFTKVTQRVPVQITLDGYQGYTLYPGTSASVTIHIHV